MTAEIAVISRVGIALAADSAVTVGTEARKIFTSSEKLFQLSNRDPVGIMTYGNAEFAGLPWEVIIKAYRAQLDQKQFPTLARYAKDFLRFLENNSWLFEPSQYLECTEQFFDDMLRVFRRHMTGVFTREARRQNGLTAQDVENLLKAHVDATAKRLVHQHAIIGRVSLTAIRKRYRNMVTAVSDRLFDKLPMSRPTRAKLATMALEGLRRQVYTGSQSGLVIAGFGENDVLPTLYHFSIEGVIRRSPRIAVHEPAGVTSRSGSGVLAFAQRDAAQTFMEGVAPNLYDYFRETSADFVNAVVQAAIRAASAVSKKAGIATQTVLDRALPKAIEQLFEAWDLRKHQLHTAPVVRMVGSLPKDELGAVAEALVNITKFKRRVTPESETVGGPIDVAIITRGDGFVWIRRKHYFDPALNPRVMARLTRSAS